MVTRHGSRWWGFERAWINSELRMVVQGFPAADELRSRWERCEEVVPNAEPLTCNECGQIVLRHETKCRYCGRAIVVDGINESEFGVGGRGPDAAAFTGESSMEVVGKLERCRMCGCVDHVGYITMDEDQCRECGSLRK
jgi:hypothetical protein